MDIKSDGILEKASTTISSELINRQNELVVRFFDMGFVASTLEDSIVLTNPIIHHTPGKQREEEHTQYEEDKAVFQAYYDKNVKVSKKLNKQVETRRMLFSEISDVYPDFCQNMQQKISEKDYKLYAQQQKKLRQIIASKANPLDGGKRAAESALIRKDKISELIDSENFSKACLIEDKFVISEFQKYLELLNVASKDVQHTHKKRSIPYGESTISAEELARKTIENRNNRVSKLNQILELFNKVKHKKYIKIPKRDKDDDSLTK